MMEHATTLLNQIALLLEEIIKGTEQIARKDYA
jgi:hypothetical protein